MLLNLKKTTLMQLNDFLQIYKPTKTIPANAEVIAHYKGIIPDTL